MTAGIAEPKKRPSLGMMIPREFPENAKLFTPRLTHRLSFRGVALFLFSLFLITGPVPEHSDLFSAVLGYSLLVVVAVVSITTLVLGWMFRSKAQLRLTYNLGRGATSNQPTSQEPLELYLRISDGMLFPLFSLRVTPFFEHDTESKSWKIVGAIGRQKEFSQEIRFPHRGYWRMSHLETALKDTFGISQFRWSSQSESFPTIAVHPKPTFSRDLPIFTAETTSGIEQTELERTEGDPYDIKRYHPSDGVRRILWKVYAKSGELLSRHPEPSMTPEGIVAIHVLAGKADDSLCSLSLSFVKAIEDQDYEFLLTADGQQNDTLASSSSEAEELFLSSVWDADSATHEERLHALDTLQNEFIGHRTTSLRRVTFFVSLERLSSPSFFSEVKLLQQNLIDRQLESLWVVLDDRGEPSELPTNESGFSRFLFTPTESKKEYQGLTDPGETLARFTSNCEAHGFPHIITR